MNIELVRILSVRLVLLACLTTMTACTALSPDLFGQGPAGREVSETSARQTVQCEEPRPKICTMQYKPVCAVLESGLITTYPSACNACADVAVSAWRPEPCEE